MTNAANRSRPLRVYIDTSVIGGCLDDEFAIDSKRIFHLASTGRLILLMSEVVIAELEPAPLEVKKILEGLSVDIVQRVAITEDIIALREAYIHAGVIGVRWSDDATHVAAATVARADAIVSWNFKHIVRLDRIKAYNQVNLAQGFGILTIVSPREVLYDDNPED